MNIHYQYISISINLVYSWWFYIKYRVGHETASPSLGLAECHCFVLGHKIVLTYWTYIIYCSRNSTLMSIIKLNPTNSELLSVQDKNLKIDNLKFVAIFSTFQPFISIGSCIVLEHQVNANQCRSYVWGALSKHYLGAPP